MINRDKLPYRQSTLAVVSNNQGKFLVVNKTAEEAVKRELIEELESDRFEIVGKSQYEYQYEWPDDVIEKTFKEKGKYFRGTELTQFWVKFTGNENEVKAGDGIRSVKWITREGLKNHLLFPNQLENTEKMIQEFTK